VNSITNILNKKPFSPCNPLMRKFGEPDNGISNATVSWIDAVMLLALWALVFATSIRSFGYIAPAVFVVLTLTLVHRNTSNGILVLLLIFYSPAITVGVPYIFSVTAGMVAFKFAFFDIPSGRRKLLLNQVIYAAMAFLFFAGIMTMFTPNIEFALSYYCKYVEGLVLLVLFHVTVDSRNELGRVFIWWAVFAGLASVIKIVHIEIGPNTVLYEMMRDVFAHDQFNVEHRTHIMVAKELARRFLLPGEEPNYTSASLVFPFTVALGFFDTSRGCRKIFWVFIACLVAVGLVGTYSRSGFIAAALVMILYLFRSNLLRAIILTSIFVCLAVAAVIMIPQFHDRIFNIDMAISEGASGRFHLWQLATEMWFQSPLYGKGMSAFYIKYRAAVHSTYLQVLAETGIIGLVLFLLVFFQACRIGLRFLGLAKRQGLEVDSRFGRILFTGIIGFFVIIGTITYQDIKLFWLACGALAALYIVTRNELPEATAAQSLSDSRSHSKEVLS